MWLQVLLNAIPSLQPLSYEFNCKDAGPCTEEGKQCQNGYLCCELDTTDGEVGGVRGSFLQKGWKTSREFGF